LLDSKNFSEEKFPTYEKMLVDYIYEMHAKVVNQKRKEELYQEQKEEEEKKKKEAEERDAFRKEVVMSEVEEFTRSLYDDVITLNHQEMGNNNSSQSRDENYYRAKCQSFYETMKAQVVTYIECCKDMNMLMVLEQ
jgi:hypothetical protein